MLLDRGALVQEGSVYRPVGEVEALEVPETLHALIAARLDGLPPEERRLLQDGSVLGKSFTRAALAALTGLGEAKLDPLLHSLVRKEVVSLQSDPRSPEHGQYGFLQDLVRHVAYETLPRRERRARHLAAAEHLSSTPTEDELTEVVASHLVEAYRLDPDAVDAPEIKRRARLALVGAGERAGSLAAAAEAKRYFEQAAELTEEPLQNAELLARAGEMAGLAGDPDTAQRLIEESIAIYEAEGDTHAAARAAYKLGRAIAFTGRRDEALARLEHAYEVISGDEPDEDLAMLAAMLSRGVLVQRRSRAVRRQNRARARHRRGPGAAGTAGFRAPGEGRRLVQPRPPRGVVRRHEARARGRAGARSRRGREHVLLPALRPLLPPRPLRGGPRLPGGVARSCEQDGEPPARVRGSSAERTYPLFMAGRWDDVVATTDEFTQEQVDSGGVVLGVLQSGVYVHIERGELDEARRILSLFSRLDGSTDVQDRSTYLAATAALRRAEGRFAEALADGAATIEAAPTLGADFQGVKHGVVDALEAALALGDTASAHELLAFIDSLSPGIRPPFFEAQAHRFRARMAA